MGNIIDSRAPFALLDGDIAGKLAKLPTPCYVIDERALIKNCEILASLSKSTGAKILLAEKAFSSFDFYPAISKYLAGTEASGLYEARLGYEKMNGKEVHIFSAAYKESEFKEILNYADSIVFNSPAQLKKFGKVAKEHKKSVGLRINPECSTQSGHSIYDPCAPGSRLGTTRDVWDRQMSENEVSLLDGLHFHTLCEQDSDALEKTLFAVKDKFGDILPKMRYLNMGGGHHITRDGYDIERLKKCIFFAQKSWGVQVYLEPGEAVALNAGYLLCRVLDIVENSGKKIAILDASAACHMPDVIEMPYTPPLLGAKDDLSSAYKYTLAGPTCLAGDIIGNYSFERELSANDLLIFGDMAIYTTCKNNTFNGMPLPDIYKLGGDLEITRLTFFGYENFITRLGGTGKLLKKL